MTFQITPLPKAEFKGLFDLSDEELEARNAIRVTATAKPGFPCRVSLADAEPGEELLLLNYQHLTGDTPYAASHAIYVREGAVEARPAPGDVPNMLTSRLLSVRGFNADKLMIVADVVEGTALQTKLDEMFSDPDVSFVDVHYAMRGCFAAKATRA